MRNLQLRLRLDAAIRQIAARLGAGARRKRRLEEFRRELDDVVQRLAPFLARFGFGRRARQRHARHRGEPLDRLGEGHALRSCITKSKMLPFLPRGEIEPGLLLVVHEERGRLLLVERRQPLPLAPGLLELTRAGPRPPKPGSRAFRSSRKSGEKRMVIRGFADYPISRRDWGRRECGACPGYSQRPISTDFPAPCGGIGLSHGDGHDLASDPLSS